MIEVYKFYMEFNYDTDISAGILELA